jgi:CRP-like cAMP-binding protein
MAAERLLKMAVKLKQRPIFKSESVIRQGDIGTEFYIIRNGRVMVSVVDEEGEQHNLAELGPGQYFGEIALLRNVPRTASCTCSAPGELLVLSRDDFIATIGADFALASQLESTSEERLQVKAEIM